MPAEFRVSSRACMVGGRQQVYAALPEDKRAALLLIARRLAQKDLWKAVGRIVNVMVWAESASTSAR